MKMRLLVSVISASLLATAAFAGDRSGVWSGHLMDPGGNPHDLTLTLKVEGKSVSGTLTGGPPDGSPQSLVNGKVDGDHLSFDIKTLAPDGSPVTLRYDGRIVGDKVTGAVDTGGGPTLTWDAAKG
jgi:hypothetical protein